MNWQIQQSANNEDHCIQIHSRSQRPGWSGAWRAKSHELGGKLSGMEEALWMELGEWAQCDFFQSHFANQKAFIPGEALNDHGDEMAQPAVLTRLHHRPPQNQHWACAWSSQGAESGS